MVEKFPMEEEEIFFFILNLKMWVFLNYMGQWTPQARLETNISVSAQIVPAGRRCATTFCN